MTAASLDLPGLGLPTRGADGVLRWGTGASIPLPQPQQVPSPPRPAVPGWLAWATVACGATGLLALAIASVALGVALAR
jgi:hypothetical protein